MVGIFRNEFLSNLAKQLHKITFNLNKKSSTSIAFLSGILLGLDYLGQLHMELYFSDFH